MAKKKAKRTKEVSSALRRKLREMAHRYFVPLLKDGKRFTDRLAETRESERG